MNIFIISDNHKLTELLVNGLKEQLPPVAVYKTGKLDSAKAMIARDKPSALVLDVDKQGSFDAAAYIKNLGPRYLTPVIAITSRPTPKSSLIQAGALDVISRPHGDELDERLLSRLASSIMGCTNILRPRINTDMTRDTKVIVIGGSTGSTNALPVVLKGLPADCPPVVCVLHMPEGYTKLYATQLNASLPQNVIEAESGTYLKRGMVVIAAGGRHLRLFRDKKGYFINSEAGVKVNGHCPSVDVLFDSAAYAAKKDAIGVILTGMGSDGAKGMLDMRKMGAYNIAESAESAVVYGMPRAAAENGAANISLSLENIAGHIITKLRLK
ncbi:chemotaxis protein CheB [Ruminococcus sp.]|uniref:chemotaxis protein CheB n=1 Tax=Ruminococcus sp. TaxID=41978 RepID=UPI0025F6E325|nr:chemotaxis protein CheB [Ruminococcus sp.]MBQ8966301.1 chemotaxis protein CheB [Ruminococcus sp.]